MAVRLGEYLVYGEINNTRRYFTSGWIILRRETQEKEAVIRFRLTGDCGEDLRGRRVRFWQHPEDESRIPLYPKESYPDLQLEQIGTTGYVSAAGWVRIMPCSVEEFMRRAHLGEPPPTTWVRRLYLEWYGQNGRVVVEIPDPYIEECVRAPQGRDYESGWRELPCPTPKPEGTPESTGGPDITVIKRDGDDVTLEHVCTSDEEGDRDESSLFTGDLERMLEEQADAVDRKIAGGGSSDDDAQDIEILDYCIEHGGPEDPVLPFITAGGPLPRPEGLGDDEVEAALKDLLARLALINISVDICDHCTPRDCYRMLLGEMLPETAIYRDIIGTGNIMHIGTYDWCKECEREIEEDMRTFEEREKGDL
jgi:lysophospholipase L1-like esterase